MKVQPTAFRSLVLCVVVMAGVAHAAGADSPQKAPPLDLKQVIGAPLDQKLTWDALSGNVVVLEFWSTTCAPCVGAIPHWNELVKKFDHKPVRFFSITDEDEKRVRWFLSKRKILGWVGLDRDGATLAAFHVPWFPHTVIVDAKGRVAGVADPWDLNEQVINDALAGKPLDMPRALELPVRSSEPPPGAMLVAPPVFELGIRPSRNDVASSSSGPLLFRAKGWTVERLVAYVADVTKTRLMVPGDMKDKKFDVSIKCSKQAGCDARSLLSAALPPALGLTMRKETRSVDVYVLTAPSDPKRLKIEKDEVLGKAFSSRTADGVWQRTNKTMESLARDLEAKLGIPVVNETGLEGGYDWEMTVGDAEPEALIAAVNVQLGLSLRKARRDINFVVAEPVTPGH